MTRRLRRHMLPRLGKHMTQKPGLELSQSVPTTKNPCLNGFETIWIAKELRVSANEDRANPLVLVSVFFSARYGRSVGVLVTATATEIAAQAACRDIAKSAFGSAWEIPAELAEEIFFWKRFIPTVEQLRAIVTTYRGIRNGSHRKRLFAAVRKVCE